MKRLNKKGFTLVELLAVIVVLAIIMVIATQAIGNVIKKNTISSFKSSLDMVAKQAKQADTMASGTLEIADVRKLADYSTSEYEIMFLNDSSVKHIAKVLFPDSNYSGSPAEISAARNADTSKYICLLSNSNGKFHNMDLDMLRDNVAPPLLIGEYCTPGGGGDCNWNQNSVDGNEIKRGTTIACKLFTK